MKLRMVDPNKSVWHPNLAKYITGDKPFEAPANTYWRRRVKDGTCAIVDDGPAKPQADDRPKAYDKPKTGRSDGKLPPVA